MRKTSTAAKSPADRRRYDSPVRRAQAAETRLRIVDAGVALAREIHDWDWRSITFRAIAERARLSERTLYRHFATERQLHEAMMRRLEEQAGVAYEGIALDDIAHVTERVFASFPAFSAPTTIMRDATFAESNRRRGAALLSAVSAAAVDWTDKERRVAAGMLDVLWTPTSLERLMDSWGFDPKEATAAVTWAIEIFIEAIREGKTPARVSKPKRKANSKRS